MANRNALIPLVVCAVVAACNEVPDPTDTTAPAPAFSYGSPGCFPGMTATQVCQYFHGPSSTATAYCLYGDCFEMTNGEAVRVVAADERDEYPGTWFTWGDCTLTTAFATEPCLLTQEGKKKTRIEIPTGATRCLTSAVLGSHRYFEHFASNPISQCLGWLECKMPVASVP